MKSKPIIIDTDNQRHLLEHDLKYLAEAGVLREVPTPIRATAIINCGRGGYPVGPKTLLEHLGLTLEQLAGKTIRVTYEEVVSTNEPKEREA